MRTEIELVGGPADGMVLSIARLAPPTWLVPRPIDPLPLTRKAAMLRGPSMKISCYRRTAEQRGERIIYAYEREEV